MKLRYPLILFIAGTLIGAIADGILPTDLANPIQGICSIAIMVAIPWGIYVSIRKILSGFKNFLFELIDKIKE